MPTLTFDLVTSNKMGDQEYVTTTFGDDKSSGFYPRDATLARSLRQRRVCLSHAGIVPSRAKAGS